MVPIFRRTVLAAFVLALAMQGGTPVRAQFGKALGQWSSFSALPINKVNHCTVLLNGSIYVIGGTTGSEQSNDSYQYSITQDSWTKSFLLPAARNYAVAEAANGKIYVIGGYSSLSPIYKIIAEVLEYDPATSTLNTKSAMPTPVAGAASIVIDNKIYVFGGSGSGGFNTDYKDLVQIYEPATDTWAQATVLPFAARSLAAAASGSSVIVAGGYNNKVAPAVKSAAYRGEISGTTIVWTKIADYPGGDGINKASAGASATKAYFTGGQTSKTVSTKTQAYDLASNTWEAQADKPNPVHSAGRFVFDGVSKLYCVAGSLISGQTNVLEAINTVTAPAMAFNGKSISTTMQIGTAKRVFNYAISNPGSGSLTWSATVAPASGEWLALSQTSGTIPPDGSTEFQVAINSKTVAPGTYSATISITSNDPSPNGTASMPISMTVTATAAKVGKRVLMEEFTGTWCGWCPYGVDSLHALLSRYPDNLVVASYHNGDPMAILSPSEENFLHVAYFPGGLVDRSYFAGETDTMVDRDSWGKYIEQRLNEPNLVDIEIVNKKFTPSTKQTTLTVKVTFNETVQAPLRVNLLQSETGQNYGQSKFAWPIPLLYPYYHEHVVKQVIPDITGDVLADVNAVPKGTVFTQDYAFISEDSIAENADLVAFVSRGDATKTGEVIQVYTEGFADRMITAVEPPLSRNFELLQNYPNPFNPSTNVVFSIPARAQVRISVYTMLGSLVATLVDYVRDAGTHAVQFNASALSSGTYLYKMEANGSTFTRTMTVLK